MRILAAFSFLFVVACGDSAVSPCQTAIDARVACMDQAGVSYDADQLEQAQTGCMALLLSKPGFGSWVDCQTAAFDAADCSNPAAVESAVEASNACGNPLE